MVCITSIEDNLAKLLTHVLGYLCTFATEQAQISIRVTVPILREEATETIVAPAVLETADQEVFLPISNEITDDFLVRGDIAGLLVEPYPSIVDVTLSHLRIPVSTIEGFADNVQLIDGCEMFTKITFYP